MDERLEWAEFVLIVCSTTYHMRVQSEKPSGKGLGARYEGYFLMDRLYEAGMENDRLLPVLFPDACENDIPRALRPFTHYRLWAQYDDLYRHLTGQPRIVAPSLGSVRELPPEPPAWSVGGESISAPSGGSAKDPDEPSWSAIRLHSTDAPKKIGGHYRLIRLLASGGFGLVYIAEDEVLRREVAIKLVSLRGASIAERDEVLAEAQTLAQLDHSHVVPVHTAGLDGETVWIVMKYVQGETLAEYIRRNGRMKSERAFHVLQQILEALRHTHRKGVIHRDIKPANILLQTDSGEDHAWLTDFGLAKIVTGRTVLLEPKVAGTLHYMSPEQITGRRVDSRTDLFALGCIAIELLTGKQAFPGSSFEGIRDALVHRTPQAIDQVDQFAGKEAVAILRRWLAKAPEDRCQSAEDALRDLEALRGTGASRRLNFVEKIRRRLARRRVFWDGRGAVDVENLRQQYRLRQRVLTDLSLRVTAGSVFGILGRNGSGKSTLLRVLIGLYRAQKGTVRVFGRDPWRARRTLLPRIGYVPEEPVAFEWMTVSDFLAFLRSVHEEWDKSYCYSLLRRFNLPLNSKISALSRGQATQLGLVAALVHRPGLLVLDDPTLGLDAVILESFLVTLGEITRNEGVTVIVASHNHDDFEHLLTHVAFMKDGSFVLTEEMKRLKLRTRQVVLTFRDEVPESLRYIENFQLKNISGRRARGAVLDISTGALERLRALGAEEVEIQELSLREIFVNYLR